MGDGIFTSPPPNLNPATTLSPTAITTTYIAHKNNIIYSDRIQSFILETGNQENGWGELGS